MKISLARKIILGALVLALAAGGAVYVLAQDESTTDTETSACALRHHRDNWHRNPLDALAELDMTIAELRDHLASGGTIQELLANSDRQAEREAAHLACIDELKANGDLTAEQAAALRAVIETGARQALREARGGGEWGKSGQFGWSMRGGRGGPGIDMRRFFGGRGIPIMPELFGKNLFGNLDELFEELEESGSLDEAMRERLEQFEEALRSGARGRFGFRIDRDSDGKWHFDWFDKDTDSDEDHSDTDEDMNEDEDSDASANNSA